MTSEVRGRTQEHPHLADETDERADRAALLVALTRASLEAQSAQARATELGYRARDLGATWQELGSAVGVSPQAAHQRWSTDSDRRGREAQRRRLERLRLDVERKQKERHDRQC